MIAGGTSSSYEVLARLASGGMAEVFIAKVTSEAAIERYVVLKRVLPELALDEQFVTMFLDEARLAAQLRHPNIAQLYDIGRLGSSYFYTMEYIHGATAWLIMERAAASGTPVPIAHVLSIGASIAAALHHAHTRVGPDRRPLGIVHRDVTPANIMVSGEGMVKLLDFGVAKAQGRRQVTRIGQVKGKIAYLSPEQCAQTTAIDGRSDIFSLGVVLYEMLTLHQLFQRNNDLATMTAIVHEQVPPPSYLRSDIPRELDGIVMNTLAKDPANRFATADALHQAIEETAARLGISTSITALARYMTSLFGNPPEPWLALEPAPTANHVTVVGAPLPPLDTTAPVQRMTLPEMAARDSADLDEKMKQVRDVRSSAPEFDVPTEIEMPVHRPSIPMAAQAPGWEDQTVSLGQPYPDHPLDHTAPEPKSSFDDDPPSDLRMQMAPRAAYRPAFGRPTTPSGGQPGVHPSMQSGGQPAVMQSGGQPAVMPSGGQPGVHPSMQSGGQPAVMQSGGQPAVMQSGGQPAVMQSGGQPILPASGAVPVMSTPGALPVMPPSGALPVMPPSSALPVMPPSGGLPVMVPSGGLPVMVPSGGLPVMPTPGALPVMPPSGALPVMPPSGALPVMPPSGALPVMPTPPPLYIKPDEDKEWNVKRLVLAAVLLLAIVALVLLLVLR